MKFAILFQKYLVFVMILSIFTSCNSDSDDIKEPINLEEIESIIKDVCEWGLPVIVINTPNSEDIVSKENWIDNASIRIYNTDLSSDYAGTLSIKGRGNSTWDLPKKPYAIKLDNKNKILSMPEHKRFCLLAEYNDIGWLRNDLVFWIGRELSNLDWTPRTQEVIVILNGTYKGLYLLTEQIKIDQNRVNVSDNGVVLEIDHRAEQESEEDPFFYVAHISSPLVIKDFDGTSESLEYVKLYIKHVDEVLFSSDYLDDEKGYKTLIDLDSFIEWYLIAEISKNSDYCFFSSCYMNLTPGSKLKMGPLWDFDRSLGWYISEEGDLECLDAEGFYIKKYVDWYFRMFSDPTFIAELKNRFEYYYSSKKQIFGQLDLLVEKTNLSYSKDFNLWHSDLQNCYSFRKARVEYLKQWLDSRLEWMKAELNNL